MNKFKLSVLLGGLLIFLIVILQNTETVETRILFITLSMPRAALLAMTLIMGIISGVALSLYWSRKSGPDRRITDQSES